MLKKIGLKLQTRRQLKINRVVKPIKGYDQASTIGIVVSNVDNFSAVKDFAKLLRQQNKKVITLYFGKEKNLPAKNENNILVNAKEIKFFGKIENLEVKQFVGTKFDFLFYLNTSRNSFLEYIMASSKATVRVGFSDKHNIPYCDMFFPKKENDTIKDTLNTVHKYIQTIQ